MNSSDQFDLFEEISGDLGWIDNINDYVTQEDR